MFQDLVNSFISGVTPDPILTYDQWAARKFILPPEAKAQGVIDFTLTPYLLEPLQFLSWQSNVRQDYWMKGIQIAVTSFYEIILHGNIDLYKKPLIMYFGSDNLASEFVKVRLDPGIENNPNLKGKIYDGWDKKNRSTLGLKILVGGIPMKFVGGISEKAYRHFSAAVILMDDIDGFPRDIGGTEKRGGQGNPIDLALNRKNARLGDYKFACSGSPTDAKTSLIYQQFKTTDQRYYEIICPHCPQSQTIDFWRIRPPYKTGLQSAVLECLGCNRLIPEKHKYDLMQIENGARWVPTKESTNPEIVGRQMSSAYSLLGYSWDEMCHEFKKASCELERGNPKPMVVFYNTKLGLPWENRRAKKRVNHSQLYESREDYQVIPESAIILTAAADVQNNRIEALVVGHGENDEMYCIEYKIIGGDTLIKYGLPGSPFNDLELFFNSRYLNSFGAQQPILHRSIDTGFRSIVVSPFLETMQDQGMEITGVFGGTGRDKRKTFVSASIQNKYGQNQRELNVNEGKTLIDNHIKNGRVHFSKHPSFTEDFFRGLTAEQFNPDTQSWEKPDYAHNEPFDLINYNLATFYIYTDGRPVEWDDYKNWNKNGCNVIVENETEGIVSKGIEF